LLDSDLFFFQFYLSFFFFLQVRRKTYSIVAKIIQKVSLMNLKSFFVVVEIIWIASLAIIVITFPIKIIIVSYYYSTYTLTPSYFNQFKSTFCLHALPKIKKKLRKN